MISPDGRYVSGSLPNGQQRQQQLAASVSGGEQMKHLFQNHDLETERCGQFIDITADVLSAVEKSEVENGTVVVYSPHTTCAVVINEPESGFMDDFCELLDEFAPSARYYRHDDLSIRT